MTKYSLCLQFTFFHKNRHIRIILITSTHKPQHTPEIMPIVPKRYYTTLSKKYILYLCVYHAQSIIVFYQKFNILTAYCVILKYYYNEFLINSLTLIISYENMLAKTTSP